MGNKEPTPAPWAVADDTVIYYDGDDEDIVADFANHEVESLGETCIGHVGYKGVDAANAAHIVKCVNHHDELVTRLTQLVRDCDNWGVDETYYDIEDSMIHARAILEKVKA